MVSGHYGVLIIITVFIFLALCFILSFVFHLQEVELFLKDTSIFEIQSF